MSELDIMQNIAAQISKLPSDQIEAIESYLRELSEAGSTSSELSNQYLTFRCDKQLFGIGIGQVIQIVQMTRITPLPDYPAYIKGVLSVRGEMVPVMDMRLRLNREEAEYNERTCIIIMNVQEHSVGLIVDAVNNVESIPREDICPAPQRAGRGVDYLTGIAQREEPVLILDMDYLLSEKEIGTILDLSEEARDNR